MPGRRTYAPLADRLWSRVDRSGGALACWTWTGHVDRRGYGSIKDAGLVHGVHRAAWILTYGPILDGLFVLHRCDNPPCVNPSHLFLGTQPDNIADRVAKGRGAVGSRQGHSRLTEDVVLAMRAARAAGATVQSLADKYGVHGSVASRAIRGLVAWRHVR